MSDTVRLALSFFVACGVTLLLTPLAIAVARRTGFFDHPAGYKGHLKSTPYLGGAAVIGGLVVAASSLGWDSGETVPILVGVLVLFAVGTIDDRLGLGPLSRLLIEAVAAAGIFAAGVGWSIFSADVLNLAFSVIFVAGVVNAYNLMDNMDGATATVAAVSGAGLGILAAAGGEVELGALAFGLSGACFAFLRFNLTSPARIFLGDGGSMPIGFAIAATIMSLPDTGHLSWVLIPVAVVLVGLPALDTSLVIVSRVRREAGVFTGGRDHLTHRLQGKLGSARRVAIVLAVGQVLLSGAGAALIEAEQSVALVGAALLIFVGVLAVALLESPGWAPATSETA